MATGGWGRYAADLDDREATCDCGRSWTLSLGSECCWPVVLRELRVTTVDILRAAG